MTQTGTVVPGRGRAPGTHGDVVIVSGLASDAHTWNLVYLQLLVEEHGHRVVNLGPCVPEEELVCACVLHRPGLVVISSVNGHGHQDGLRAIRRLRACPELAGTPVVIGGKLGTGGAENTRHVGSLLAAGFDAVFGEGADSVAVFRTFLTGTGTGTGRRRVT